MSRPHDELEVKARVEDPGRLEGALETAGATLEFRGEMVDRRFDRAGELAIRDEVLRLRILRPESGSPWGEMGWKGPVSVQGAYRHRSELELRVDDPAAAIELVTRLGFEESLRIERRIATYRLGGATLRIEWYPEMDVLVEVEGDPSAIERAIGVTGLPRASFQSESLPFFVTAYETRTGRRARLAQ